MKFEIKHRVTGTILFSCETETLRLAALHGANLSRATLRGADLSRADLSGATLRGSDLSGADLYGADLHGANLSYADLSGSDLSGANLSGSDLSYADLSRANLHGADLSGATLHGSDLSGASLYGADLSGANLSRATLRGADLHGANLHGAKNINKHLTTPLYGMLDQRDPIIAYKLVKDDGQGPFNGGITYVAGQTYEVQGADTDEYESCGAGINLATLDWCLRHYEPGYRILIAEFHKADIAAIPIGSDGKFRVHRCRIVREKPLSEVGL